VFDELLENRVPPVAIGLGRVPLLPRDRPEPILLVVVVGVRWPRLDVVVIVQGLEQPVEVRESRHAQLGLEQGVHARDALTVEVDRPADARRVPLVDDSGHDVGRVRTELEPVHALLLRKAHSGPHVLRGSDRLVRFLTRPDALVGERPGPHDLVRSAARLPDTENSLEASGTPRKGPGPSSVS